jgi:hypothetical protein
MSDPDYESITNLIDRRVRDALAEMGDRPPRDKEALAGTVEKLLRAKPMAADHGLDLLALLKNLDKGPKPMEEDDE